jgi:hypothetical protein
LEEITETSGLDPKYIVLPDEHSQHTEEKLLLVFFVLYEKNRREEEQRREASE